MDRTSLPLPLRDAEILRASEVRSLMYPAPSKQTGAGSFLFQLDCSLGCTYCSAKTLYGSKLTKLSSEFVVDEMRELKDEFRINTGFFSALTFNLRSKLSEELCRQIVQI